MTPTPKDRQSYERWAQALGEMCEQFKRLERLKGTEHEGLARDLFQSKARRIDALVLPFPWKSWQHLGDAIHGRAYRPKTW